MSKIRLNDEIIQAQILPFSCVIRDTIKKSNKRNKGRDRKAEIIKIKEVVISAASG